MLQGILRIHTILPGEIATKGKKIYLRRQWIILLHASSIKFMPIAVKIWKEDTKRTLTNQSTQQFSHSYVTCYLFRNYSQAKFHCPRANNQQLKRSS